MNQFVVEAAEQYEVVKLGGSSVGPMNDVVSRNETAGSAPRKGAPAVAEKELAHQPLGDVARRASDADGTAAGIPKYRLKPAVTKACARAPGG
jgi:hypothetical protein